jgi:ParB family chromosome partitioning protein
MALESQWKQASISFGEIESIKEKKEALIETVEPRIHKKRKLADVDASNIKIDGSRPRTHFDDAKIKELADSMQKNGLLQPIVCTVTEDGHLLLAAGERRLRAAKLAGITKLPVWTIEGDPFEVSVLENIQRENLTTVEEAEALLWLREKKGYQQEELGKILSKAESTISEILKVTTLPSEILNDCRNDPDMPRDILVKISRMEATKEQKIESYMEFKTGKITRKDLISVKHRSAEIKSIYSHMVVTSFAKRISHFRLDDMAQVEKDNLYTELEKLQATISETLSKLRGYP